MNHPAPEEAWRFEGMWQRFEEWLAQNAPADHHTLRSGASSAEIAKLQQEIGFSVHDDLKLLLTKHNGVIPRRSSMGAGGFVLGYSLLDTRGILEWQQNLAAMAREAVEEGYTEEVVGRTAHEQWVPFAQSLTGDLLFVDHRSDHFGGIGEISFGSPEYLWLWPGLGLMFHDMCVAVEGMARLPTLGRRPSVHEARMLEWVVG
ncbi:SMI1/KNR4 family protein [Streptomyces flavofungini]|uniref:SMI1/KNR4 family protein n=1 Tax=Streptomyces flavofungini TaxID=68200 RepID=UPI0025AF912D|nr:SMI1/KNR4 family protein [Streptomyces flavofungini]WJV44538.1 SMI1/KNR4 family protein [Streptomyces flavofungini]